VLRTASAVTERAAHATAGQILLFRGAPASVYYSASCGGYTALPSAVWPGADDPPYLPSREDDACEREPAWTADIGASELQRTLTTAGLGGRLTNMRIVSRDGSGRVARLELSGMTPNEISGADLRAAAGRTLGWLSIKSTAFDLRRDGDIYHFSGHGFGHGVGLCVLGSVKLASSGASAGAILHRYFPGLVISSTEPRVTSTTSAGRQVLVSLPDGDEGEHNAIVALTSRSRDDLAHTLGVPPPQQVALRFHSTTTDYEQATHAAWFTSAAVVNAEVHLVPLASLRARGVLERTIRRELVHLMTDAVLIQKPAWVREGAALFFADEGSTDVRGQCPGDAELLQPTSIGALADAYGRARGCFARQIASGRSWRDVR
jgi:stage II sporulation protein D